MSLVGFKAQNHPQQTDRRGALPDVDDRGTDQAYFDALSERFGGFTLDVAASPHNAKCEQFFTYDDDGILQQWCHHNPRTNARVWCNPPYSDVGRWVQKAWDEFDHWRSADLIVMLVPANRCEQAWWQRNVEPHRDRPDSPLHVEFLRGRMRFDRPGAVIGPKGDRPPFGCCLLIWSHDPIPPRTDLRLEARTTAEQATS